MSDEKRIVVDIGAASAALDANPALGAMLMQSLQNALWADISTAPKDGSAFLGFNTKHPSEPYDIWHWDANAETDGAPGFWVNQADSNLDDFPTHWQPLPEGPTK